MSKFMPASEISLFSVPLGREVNLSVLYPMHYDPEKSYRLVLFNDGQDFGALGMKDTAEALQEEGTIPPVFVVGIHANIERIYEYGIAARPDYAGRGDKAGLTTEFVVGELLPFLADNFMVLKTDVVYAGFSLGGLMAMDIAGHYPHVFSHAGIFSGSLWWRQVALGADYESMDRIMHAQIRNSPDKPPVRFWFQCGSLDETDDRDADGVIDSIQDTLECISELEKKGYKWNQDVFYIEVAGGEHNSRTWSLLIPAFLKWALTS